MDDDEVTARWVLRAALLAVAAFVVWGLVALWNVYQQLTLMK